MKKFPICCLLALLASLPVHADESLTLLKADRVFDGERMHADWVVLVESDSIVYAGPSDKLPDLEVGSTLELTGQTLMPGLIEGHSHILLHPYDEADWNDQVLKEPEAERVVRAVNHVNASLMAGVTTMRDLGTEGAGFADVSVRDSIDKGIIPGPRLLVAGRALVATGSYGPKGFHEGVDVALGAQAADGVDDLSRAVRQQIGRNVDFIKVYADYRWGPGRTAMPTFTLSELKTIVEITTSSGRPVVAHAATAEGMRRAVQAGVETIEHGYGASNEIYKLMVKHDVALCPTLAAGEAISRYSGWRKGIDPEPARVSASREAFQAALAQDVTICFGGDVGVYAHGENYRELELMAEYGMDSIAVLQSATSVNADLFHVGDKVGRLKAGLLADIIAVDGNPGEDISVLRRVGFVMKGGTTYRDH